MKNAFMTLLVILVVVLGGYIVYDKVISDDNNKVDDNKIPKCIVTSELLDLAKLADYKNYDETYGTQTNYYYSEGENSYSISLTLDGKVRACINRVCHELSTDKVIDLVELSVAGDVTAQKYFMLLDNGDVYYYTLGDLIDKKYETTKVTDVSNIAKLVSFSYGPKKDAGGVWGIIAITNDGNYTELARESV